MFEKAAKQDFAKAQNSLGAMYAAAEGIRQNYTQAKKWFEKAAGKGM